VRVVFDTNIYISAFAIPGGQAEDAYLKAIQGNFELFSSVPILTGTATVLQRKFDWSEDRTRAVVQAIAHVSTIVASTAHLTVVKDEPDNRILECAIAADADVIVTGDRHLLLLKQYQDIRVIRLADFLSRFS
jgi:putative PIN family toxin of toxin-antitoxin system